jgi:hypothetical protein
MSLASILATVSSVSEGSMSQWLVSPFISALFGALGGVATALIGSWIQYRRERTSIAWSIVGELDGLRLRYLNTIGEKLDFSLGFAEPRFNYFAIFDGNASKIGLLDKEDALEVARVYVLAKGHFENLINYMKWIADPSWNDESKRKFQESMTRDHQDLLEAVPRLTARLKNYSITPSNGFGG